MNIERLFEFQVLAQVLHYGKAADKLYMAQSVLSRHIQDMENELNVQLFLRGPHGVSLTNAGAVLYRMLWEFMDLESKAQERMRIAATNISGSVFFGCLRPVMCDKLEDFFGRFCESFPEITLLSDIIDNLDNKDISEYHCLCTSSTALSLPECFRLKHVFHEKCWLVLPLRSKFNNENEVSLKSLGGETIFLPGYHGSVGSFARIAQIIEQTTSGRAHIVRVSTPETALVNVNMGRGMTILPRHRLDERKRNVNHVPVKEDLYFDTLLYHNNNVDNPATLIFEEQMIRWMEQD